MIIEFQITRLDLIKSYFHNLRYSNRSQILFFGAATITILYFLFEGVGKHGKLILSDIIWALSLGLSSIIFYPTIMLLAIKTKKRTVTISQEGIETKSGVRKGMLSWTAVDRIDVTKERIFILDKYADFFPIPTSAFANEDLRKQFIELAAGYHENSKIRPGNKHV